ncbi:MAG: adenylosuccinate lyase, partial [Acidimicrobiia bacterium]|nr:adenylosuccinate lyase [Acidimicrobiia bacterium]
ERYSTPEMSVVWSDEHKLAVWKEVETLVVEAWVAEGIAPQEAAEAARRAPEVDEASWLEREKTTNHDVAAFVDLLAGSVDTGGEWIHFGLTSSDVLDTASGVLLQESGSLLLAAVGDLFDVVKRRAFEFRDTPSLGRTHGIWAEPTSFGLKLANWAFEVHRDHERLVDAVAGVSFGKISGAVGTYAHTPPSVEHYVCSHLGLGIEPASTQVIPRDRHAHFLSVIAGIGASIERFATEIRHLQRSEVGEAREAFGKGQKGSSAMPHKRNPIASENLTGVARVLRGYASAGLENVALWHERDISHSSVERIVLPDATGLLHYALRRITRVIDDLVVDTDRLAANLESTRGLVYSQAVLLALIDSGLTRDHAYRIVQRNAMKTWDDGGHLSDHLTADPEVTLDPSTLADCFTVTRFLRHTDTVFQRLDEVSI